MGCHAQIAAAPASCTAAKANSASQTNIRTGQMNIDNTARATRKYSICETMKGETMKDGGWRYVVRNLDTKETILVPQDVSPEEFRDRLNLLAVLEAIREPTQAMIDAAPGSDLRTLHGAVYVWRAMIDALIAEVKDA